MGTVTPAQQRLLDEALVLSADLEDLAEEGLAATRGANVVIRSFVGSLVRKGTGTTLEGLRDEAHANAVLLAAIGAGEADLQPALPQLAHYARLVSDTARFVEGLGPVAEKRIKNEETRRRIEGLAKTHMANAHRLADVLGELQQAR